VVILRWVLVIRLVFSILGSLIPLLIFFGPFSPFGPSSPDLSSLLRGDPDFFARLLQGEIQYLLPFGAAGGTGFTIWTILSRVLPQVESLAYSTVQRSHPSDIMRSIGMPGFGYPSINIPKTLPPDFTKSQYLILSQVSLGYSKPKDIAKFLFMDKKEVKKEMVALKANGYLTKGNKLTSKALETLTQSETTTWPGFVLPPYPPSPQQMGVKTQPEEDPLEILKQKFARGEITKEQYEEMKKILESK